MTKLSRNQRSALWRAFKKLAFLALVVPCTGALAASVLTPKLAFPVFLTLFVIGTFSSLIDVFTIMNRKKGGPQ